MTATIFFQSDLPKEIQPNQWVRIQFVQFGQAVVYIQEIREDKLVGFNATNCKLMTFRINCGQVLNGQNWWPRSYEMLSLKEVRAYVLKRQEAIEAEIAQTRSRLEHFETYLREYRQNVPDNLKEQQPA